MSVNRMRMGRPSIGRLQSAGLVSSEQIESVNVAAEEVVKAKQSERQACQRADAAEREIDNLREQILETIQDAQTSTLRTSQTEARAEEAEREVVYLRDRIALLEQRIQDATDAVTRSNEAQHRALAAENEWRKLAALAQQCIHQSEDESGESMETGDASEQEVCDLREKETILEKTMQDAQEAELRSNEAKARAEAAEREVENLRDKTARLEQNVLDANDALTKSTEAQVRADLAEMELEQLREEKNQVETRIREANTAITTSHEAQARALDAERRCKELEAKLAEALTQGAKLEHAAEPNELQQLVGEEGAKCFEHDRDCGDSAHAHTSTACENGLLASDCVATDATAEVETQHSSNGYKASTPAETNERQLEKADIDEREKDGESQVQASSATWRIGEALEVAAVAAFSEVTELLRFGGSSKSAPTADSDEAASYPSTSSTTGDAHELPKLAQALIDLGFSEVQAREAAQRCSSVEAAVEWIISGPLADAPQLCDADANSTGSKPKQMPQGKSFRASLGSG